jgi:hypothetical protein
LIVQVCRSVHSIFGCWEVKLNVQFTQSARSRAYSISFSPENTSNLKRLSRYTRCSPQLTVGPRQAFQGSRVRRSQVLSAFFIITSTRLEASSQSRWIAKHEVACLLKPWPILNDSKQGPIPSGCVNISRSPNKQIPMARHPGTRSSLRAAKAK